MKSVLSIDSPQLDLSQLTDPVTWIKKNPSPLEKGIQAVLKMYASNPSPVLLQCEQWPFTKTAWIEEVGKGYAGLQELLHNSFELILISGDLKCYCDLPVRVGAYGGPVIMKFWPRSISQWAQQAPKPNLCLFPLFHNTKLVDILRRAEFPHWFPDT